MLKITRLPLFIVALTVAILSLLFNVNAKIKSLNAEEKQKLENKKPDWLNIISEDFHEADQDDLVTAGMGFSKLSMSKQSLTFQDPDYLTAKELRKAKLNRFISAQAGEGNLWGYNKKNLTPLFDGKIAGNEIFAEMNLNDEKVLLLLHVPLDFSLKNPCIVAVPTMDFEGVYNAKDIQIRGLWGLKKNCAVVYNDKGLGNALYEIDSNNGYKTNGEIARQTDNKKDFLFKPEQIKNNSSNNKNRYAVKSLHSGINYEANWGNYVINSIEFAFYQLNALFAPKDEILLNKDNTKVFVYGVSDGAGAALRAGEADKNGVIDGIVAVNPQIQLKSDKNAPLYIKYGEDTKVKLDEKSVADYSTYGALYIPCAILALRDERSIYTMPDVDHFRLATNRCQALKKEKLLSSNEVQEQAKEALNKLYKYGFTESMNHQLAYFYMNNSINFPYRYISQYGKFKFDDRMCGYSVASIDQELLYNEGEVKPLSKINFANLWINNTGILPIRMNNNLIAIDLVNDDDPNGAHREYFSRSKNSNVIDYNLQGAICLRNQASSKRVKDGIAQVLATGKINQIKTIIVHGQQNIRHLPDFTARAYVAKNSYAEGSFSNLKYIEVENASYLDSAIPFDNTLIGIDYYAEQAMNLVWDAVYKKTSLPENQVIRSKPRGGKIGFAPAININNLPPIKQIAEEKDRISVNNGTIFLPK